MKTTKIRMKLEGKTRTHILNPHSCGAEFSLCGMQCVEDDDFCEMEYLGETDGKATCSECLDVVKFCKAL